MMMGEPAAPRNVDHLSDTARVKAAGLIQPERLVSDAERALAAKPDASGTVDEYRIEVFDAAGLPDELKEWTFQLVKTNMEATYKAAGWSWDDAKKRNELLEPAGRYLILYPASSQNTEPVGMVYFQFTMEDDGERADDKQMACIYCYEIQLTAAVQAKGIGSHLMRLLEEIGRRQGMRKCMLTVLRINKLAMNFYQKLGYKIDLISPSKCLPKHKWKAIPYEILSKKL